MGFILQEQGASLLRCVLSSIALGTDIKGTQAPHKLEEGHREVSGAAEEGELR